MVSDTLSKDLSITCLIIKYFTGQEGDELGTDKFSVRYFYIAKGSSAELMTQLIIASEIGYIDHSESEMLVDECDKISSMLTKLILARSK